MFTRAWLAAGSAIVALNLFALGPAAPKTHIVRMQGSRFVPSELTIETGDTVRFVMGTGGPHNVGFRDLKGAGADRLRKLMPDTIGSLSGPLLLDPGQTYQIVFTDVPAGAYPFWCVPHISSGMTGTITVR